jgi:hypothetical protein
MDFFFNGYIAYDRNIENINIEKNNIEIYETNRLIKKWNNTTYLICTITMGYTGWDEDGFL